MTTANLNAPKVSLDDQAIDPSLPEGWSSTVLQNIVSYKKGKKPKRLEKDLWQWAVPYIDIEAFEKGNIRRYADPDSSVLVNEGDVVVVWDGARCGHVGKVPKHGALGSTLMTIKPIMIDSDYLLRFLQLSYDTINSNPRGTGIPHVAPEIFWNLELPLAPLAEQKRIVAKVEELLVRVNATREHLAKVKEILKRFRQSVLAAACSGRLTKEWRQGHPNIQTAGELVKKVQLNEKKRYLQECEDAKEGGKRKPRSPSLLQLTQIASHSEINTWTMLKMDYAFRPDGLFDGPFGSNLKTEDYTQGGVRVIRIENIGFLSFLEEKRTYISAQKYESLKKHTVGEGDLIFTSFISEGVRVVVLPKIEKSIAKADCFCLRPLPQLLDSRYLAIILSSSQTYFKLIEGIHGATRPRITTNQLRNLDIPLAPLEEQKEIVRHVEVFFNLADSIEKRVAAAGERAESLSQAILAKAFRGELVQTEVELARREGRSYEPASALLERIRKAREEARFRTKKTKNKEQ